ncbi:hypothetical protein C0992_003320 [Termitomyces sp. T32_za158]|nr:hypothetical protein C0992_003320 [Termitomyces sp. T32_za158]
MSATRKGKGKVVDHDFEDLNPTITYRHLHSHNLGVRDPLRVIALCDSDAFYAACEMVRLGVDKNTPLVVLQWDALIAINYPARKFGITRLKKYNMKELQAKHPELKIVHVATYKEGEKQPGYWDNVDTKTHKVSLDYYRKESLKIAAKFKECLPRVEIEKASIDEAFFDFSNRVREVLLERYPYLARVPPNAPNGADTPLPPPPPFSWDDIKHSFVIPIHPTPPEGDKKDGTDLVCALKGQEHLPTWHDIALSIGAELMEAARRQVFEQLGYSTSAGISRNKFLAKLTASYKKPKNQSILRNAAIPDYLRPLPFQKIRFLGGKLGTAIASEFEAATVEDLLCVDFSTNCGAHPPIHQSTEVMQRKFGEESIWIYEVLRYGLTCSRLSSSSSPSSGIDRSEGYNTGQSKQAVFPFTPEVTVDTIAAAANALWKDLVGENLAMKVTNVSLAFTGIEGAEHGQRSIEGFLQPGQPTKRQRDNNSDDDECRRVSFDGDLDDENNEIFGDVRTENQRSDLQTFSFKCSRCSKTLSIPPPLSLDGEEQLAALRLEHDDFHFAQDLAKEALGGRPIILRPSTAGAKHDPKPPSRNSPKKKKSRKGEPREFVPLWGFEMRDVISDPPFVPLQEVNGVIVVDVFALFSSVALVSVASRVIWLAVLQRISPKACKPKEYIFFNTQLGYYAICLLVGNMITDVSGLIGLQWLLDRGITKGFLSLVFKHRNPNVLSR